MNIVFPNAGEVKYSFYVKNDDECEKQDVTTAAAKNIVENNGFGMIYPIPSPAGVLRGILHTPGRFRCIIIKN